MTVIYWIEEWDLVIIHYAGNLTLAGRSWRFGGAVEVFLESRQ